MNFQQYDDLFNRDNYPMFSSKDFSPIDDKACVCLSGNLYKDCCKKEVDEAASNRKKGFDADESLEQLYSKKDRKLLSFIVEEKSLNKKNISYCSAFKVFGNCDNENYMRRSHTMSEGTVLKNLSDGDKIIRFNDHKMIMMPDKDRETLKNEIVEHGYSEEMIQNASVTVSFCTKHDTDLFSAIETDGNSDYSGSNIQNLEYALKAITFDLYYKIMSIRYMSELIKKNKYVVFNPDGSKSKFLNDYNNLVDALFDLYPLMLKILEELKLLIEKDVEPELETVIFELPLNKVNFSLSEIMNIEDTFCYTNVINAKKPYIIVSYYKKNGRIVKLDKLKEQFELNQLNKRARLKCLWPLIKEEFLMNALNIYFNKRAFDRFSDIEKVYLYVIHREGNLSIPDAIQHKHDKEIMRILFGL